MTERRFILEMGMGNDLHGMSYQKAAARAIESAFRRSTIPMFETTPLEHTQMRVQVTVGVREPDKLDTDALSAMMPRGRAQVTAVEGGQNLLNPETGETIVVATAAVEAFLPDQSAHWRARSS
ncbi:Lin0512 family protein [Roseovarius aestuariivivens]|uniref:Lin0512 family protein n=1 Tax=Roseovarius aestuariivivens TaxID=1888910 RepID=UPI0010819301|nr:Lin0512 family protein [Roseovarius aestuariivivens]